MSNGELKRIADNKHLSIIFKPKSQKKLYMFEYFDCLGC